MYFHLIRNFPALTIGLTFVACLSLFWYVIKQNYDYNLEDPIVGFEARRTEISNRINTWRLLVSSTSAIGGLSFYPKVPQDESSSNVTKISTRTSPKKHKHRNKNKGNRRRHGKSKNPFDSMNHQSDSFFCGKLVEDYVHFIVESNDGRNLMELTSIKNICKLDKYVLRLESDQSSCAFSPYNLLCKFCEVKNFENCCPSWSLPNYILVHSNKTDCDLLNQNDIDEFVKLLNSCSSFYADNYLSEDCSVKKPSTCPNTPLECFDYENLVFNVFRYLVDYRFLDINQKIIYKNDTATFQNNSHILNPPFLSTTSIFLPLAKSSKLLKYYDEIQSNQKTFWDYFTFKWNKKNQISYNDSVVVAADLGLKHTLFNKLVISDLILPTAAFFIILISLLIFTRSTLLSVMTLLTNFVSLTTAYSIYVHFLNIDFFPFLNLLSFIILVAIGSDNALIYCKAWSCTTSDPTSPALNRRQHQSDQELKNTLKHVLMSSFCASITTLGAFFAAYFSDITSLKCFSIFSGLAIICNFLITALVFPSAIVISDQIAVRFDCWQYFYKYSHIPQDFLRYLFDKAIMKIVFNLHYWLVVTLSFVPIFAVFIIFYSPGLKLPDSQDLQLFNSDHLFERYDLEYRNVFWFSRMEQITSNDQNGNQTALSNESNLFNYVFPIRIVFGLIPEDNGNPLNPFDRGTLKFDPFFNMSHQTAQSWLLEFCRDIRTQDFYRPTLGPLLKNCYIETLVLWMEKRKCLEMIGGRIYDHYPCCELSRFPYLPLVFDQCLAELIERLHRTPNFVFNANQAGPRFNISNGKLSAFVIEYDSVYDASTSSFEDIDLMWHKINEWVVDRVKYAPYELRKAWFITSNMEFYSLQNSLSSGVAKSLLISVLIAFVALTSTTLHIRLSIISIISISCVIFSSIGSLVLLGWRLNIIEIIIVTLTIGLSIDATLHYTIAYKTFLKTTNNRLLAMQMTIARIGSPVSMGNITTFIAGAIMLFSNVFAYNQIGIFLMTISFFSMIYSTFFHLGSIVIFGSESGFLINSSGPLNPFKYFYCFFNYLRCKNICCTPPNDDEVDNDNYYNNNNNSSSNNNSNDNMYELGMMPRSSTTSACCHVTSI